MICIRDKFSQNIGRQVPSKVIWDHLSTMYDMQALVSWAWSSLSSHSQSPSFPQVERATVRPPCLSLGSVPPVLREFDALWTSHGEPVLSKVVLSSKHKPSNSSRFPVWNLLYSGWSVRALQGDNQGAKA